MPLLFVFFLYLFAGGVIKLAAMTMTLQTQKSSRNEITQMHEIYEAFFRRILSCVTLYWRYVFIDMYIFILIRLFCFHNFGGFMLYIGPYRGTTQSTSFYCVVRSYSGVKNDICRWRLYISAQQYRQLKPRTNWDYEALSQCMRGCGGCMSELCASLIRHSLHG